MSSLPLVIPDRTTDTHLMMSAWSHLELPGQKFSQDKKKYQRRKNWQEADVRTSGRPEARMVVWAYPGFTWSVLMYGVQSNTI